MHYAENSEQTVESMQILKATPRRVNRVSFQTQNDITVLVPQSRFQSLVIQPGPPPLSSSPPARTHAANTQGRGDSCVGRGELLKKAVVQ